MKKFYVVWKGRTPGVYDNWEACKKEVEGFQGALYKGFPDKESAEAAYAKGFAGFEKTENGKWKTESSLLSVLHFPFSTFIAVDAACSGNPGKMEYQGKYVVLGTESEPPLVTDLFKSPVFENGTNNIGEFLAIVHGLALMKKQGKSLPIYSDSRNAMSWVKQKKCRTKLERNAKTDPLFQLIERAEKWLHDNTLSVPIIKWDKNLWGETPADFGRK